MMANDAPKVRRSLGDLSEGTLGTLMLLPTAFLLCLIVVYPVGRLVYISLFDWRMNLPNAVPQFIGFEHYIYALTDDPKFWEAVYNTVLITVITVPGALVVGLGLALLANLPFKHRWPTRLALLLPWALPLVFAGLIFRWFFNYDYGLVNDILARFGIGKVLWGTEPNLAFATICLVIIWKSSSFMAMILLAGLQTIPRNLYEAARVDGATPWQCFWKITLPMLMPSIVVALVFRTITAIQTFDIPYAMTGGGPGGTTETLAMYIHKTTIDFLDFGYGSALAMLMFLVSLVATIVYLRIIQGDKE
jgi:multiple sugar transport system permease protein